MGYHAAMDPAGSFLKLASRRAAKKGLLDMAEDELHAYVRSPLWPRPVLRALLVLFGVSAMLVADWFGLLLLNHEGVIAQMGPLNVLRVTAALMAGIALPSILLVPHYKRIYTYTSEENVFFTITFSLSFLLGAPCALVGIFA